MITLFVYACMVVYTWDLFWVYDLPKYTPVDRVGLLLLTICTIILDIILIKIIIDIRKGV